MDELTVEERAVARLLTAGYSNVAIAKELSISVRTVDNLVYAVFAKCDVTSRTELTRIVST